MMSQNRAWVSTQKKSLQFENSCKCAKIISFLKWRINWVFLKVFSFHNKIAFRRKFDGFNFETSYFLKSSLIIVCPTWVLNPVSRLLSNIWTRRIGKININWIRINYVVWRNLSGINSSGCSHIEGLRCNRWTNRTNEVPLATSRPSIIQSFSTSLSEKG